MEAYKLAMDKALDNANAGLTLAEISRKFDEEKNPRKEVVGRKTRGGKK